MPMNKLIEMAVNCLHPIRTYRRIVELQESVSELEEAKKSLEINLAKKCLSNSENESQLKASLSQSIEREKSLVAELNKVRQDFRHLPNDVKVDLNRITQLEDSKRSLEIKLAETALKDSEQEKELKLSLDDALKREDSLKSQNESLLTEVAKLEEEVRLKHTDVLKKLEVSEHRCKSLDSTIDYLKRELETAREDAIQFRKQASSLKEWIRHVHRLDSIPVSHSIKDILQKAQV